MDVYYNERTFSVYCGDNNIYELQIEMDSTRLSLFLKKEAAVWRGNLSHYEHYELIEEIPASIVNDSLVLYPRQSEPKTIPLDSILLYQHFNPDKFEIDQAFYDSFDYPLEEIRGTYPVEEITSYTDTLYSQLFSNLTSYHGKEDYYSSVEKLKKVTYIRNMMYEECPGHGLFFGFDGNESINWNPVLGNIGDISMLMREQVFYIP